MSGSPPDRQTVGTSTAEPAPTRPPREWWRTPLDATYPVLRSTTSVDDSVGMTEARLRLTQWAEVAGLSPEMVHDIGLAGHEALTNAAEHAYRSGVGVVDLFAGFLGGGVLLITVRDYGRWLQPTGSRFRGHGLMMMRGLADSTGFEISTGGTVVHLGWNATPTSP